MLNLPRQRLLCPASALLLLGSAFSIQAEPRPGPAPGSPPLERGGRPPGSPPDQSSSPSGERDPFADLSPKERERAREAVRRAWSDPAVLQARDEVKAATEAYQKALQQAIKHGDPEIAEVLEAWRRSTETEFRSYVAPGVAPSRGGSGPGGSSARDRRDFEGFLTMESPSFLRDLDDSQRQIYRQAHAAAMASPEVKNQLQLLRAFRQEDEEMRQRRTEAILATHQAIRAALVEADPRVAGFLPKPGESPRWNRSEDRSAPSSRKERGEGRGPDREDGTPPDSRTGPPPAR